MDRNQIIENYLALARNAQEAEYYWENNTGSEEAYVDATDAAHLYYRDNCITRQELTDHNDAKRGNVIKCDNVNDALSAMENFFSR
jgi:hypothetical protein